MIALALFGQLSAALSSPLERPLVYAAARQIVVPNTQKKWPKTALSDQYQTLHHTFAEHKIAGNFSTIEKRASNARASRGHRLALVTSWVRLVTASSSASWGPSPYWQLSSYPLSL